jgi:hypothetical protein
MGGVDPSPLVGQISDALARGVPVEMNDAHGSVSAVWNRLGGEDFHVDAASPEGQRSIE